MFRKKRKTGVYNVVYQWYTMVNRVVSTKLSEQEHHKALEICNDTGCTLSSLVRQAILEQIDKRVKEKTKTLKPSSKRQSQENTMRSTQLREENDDRYQYF